MQTVRINRKLTTITKNKFARNKMSALIIKQNISFIEAGLTYIKNWM